MCGLRFWLDIGDFVDPGVCVHAGSQPGYGLSTEGYIEESWSSWLRKSPTRLRSGNSSSVMSRLLRSTGKVRAKTGDAVTNYGLV